MIVQRPAATTADWAHEVTISSFLTLLPILFGFSFGASGEQSRVRSLVVEEQLIIRVPVRPQPRIEWTERKGPKCIPAGTIRGAFLSGEKGVDFVLAGRKLLRAEIDDECPALDFYGGFYLNSEDGKICAKRDSVRSRIGGSCRIKRFRTLEPK